MNYYDALTKLNLKTNFTEEDLKKAYRQLMKEYHPDLFANTSQEERESAEEKTKEINEAYDIICKSMKGQNSISNNNQKQDAKKAYIDSLYNNLLSFTSKIDIPELKKYDTLIKDVIKLFRLFASDVVDENYKPKVDKLYYQHVALVKERFENLKQEFYSKNGLDENEISETLNYNCSLDAFYNQLLNIEKKYNIERRLKTKLEQEVLQYTNYAGYSKIKNLVNLIKKQTISKILKDEILRKGFRDNEESLSIKTVIARMHEEISNLFATYHNYVKKINSLKETVEKINNDNIRNKFANLEEQFNKGTSFANIDKLLNELLVLIDEFTKKEEYKKKSMPLISKPYAQILNNYKRVIETLSSESDFKKISIANKAFEDVLASLQLIYLGEIKIEALAELEKVDFLSETQITQKLLLNNDLNREEKSGIFIRKENIKGANDVLIGKIIEITSQKITLMGKRFIGEGNSELTKKELDENYISIEEFLANSAFIGDSYYILNSENIILYGNGAIKIVLNENTHEIEVKLINISKDYKNESASSLMQPYKNKDYMLQELIKYVDNIIRHNEEEKISQNNSRM